MCQLFTDTSAGSSETKTGTNVEYDLGFFDMNSAGNSIRASSWHRLVLDSEYYETAGAIVN